MSRPPSGPRAARVLAMIPWVVAQDGATVEEIAEQFGVSAETVRHDLTEAMCYEAGARTTAVVVGEDGEVYAVPGGYLDRPRRLSHPQALAILTALDTMRLDQPTALDSLRAKLQQAVGAAPGQLAVSVDEPPFLAAVRRAVSAGRRLHLRYHAASTDEVSEREVDPYRIVAFGGAWQLFAWCLAKGGWRRFRVDRIQAAYETGAAAEDHGEPQVSEVFDPSEDAARVVIDLTAAQGWAAERYPHELVERRPDGSQRIAIWVAGTAWLERLLLRLGPDAVVVLPAEFTSLQRAAARRVLARYRMQP
jgi:proteasome accessory factor C